MPQSYPKLRANWPPKIGSPVEVKPADRYPGCVVVEGYADPHTGDPKMRIALYVDRNQAEITYTAAAVASAWLVDLPDGFSTSRGEIRTAILNGPGKPDPPPHW